VLTVITDHVQQQTTIRVARASKLSERTDSFEHMFEMDLALRAASSSVRGRGRHLPAGCRRAWRLSRKPSGPGRASDRANPGESRSDAVRCERRLIERRGRAVTTVHQVRVQDLAASPTLTALCAGYELGDWRAQPLVDDVFGRHLTSFALSFTDLTQIDGETADGALRKAAQAVYATDKYRRRGEFGELLLHAAAKDFFGAQPAVSKIYYKDSDNDTVKGFDCVHVIEHSGQIELWLGEVKFYKDLGDAIDDSASELITHLQRDFLRREFVAITNKLDEAWPHTVAVRDLLDSARSLDEILPHLVIPVMLTYDSPAVASHHNVCAEYVEALRSEAENAWMKFKSKFTTPYPVTLHLILVPLENKERLTNLFHQKLQIWRHI
jgi:hypothetical protein